MSSDYFDSTLNRVTDGARALANDVNSLKDATGAGFDLLPSESELKNSKSTYGVDSGAADAYVITSSHAKTSYIVGMEVVFIPLNDSTGPATVNLDSLGAKNIKQVNGDEITAQTIQAEGVLSLRYNGTNFIISGGGYTEAGGFAAAASASATAAATSETAAAASETAAGSSATAAGVSETNAAASAVAAGVSETNAAASAVTAAAQAALFRGGANVKAASGQSVTSSGLLVAFDNEILDTDDIHDDVTNNERLTVPAGVTHVKLTAQISFATSTAQVESEAYMRVNGGPSGVATKVNSERTVSAAPDFQLATGPIAVTPGWYFDIMVSHTGAGSADLSTASTWFAMEILGRS